MTAMSTHNRTPEPASADLSEAASRNTLALNPLVGIRGQDLVDSAGILFKAVMNEPKVATEQWLSFVGELGSIVAGKSERAPKAGDKAAWGPRIAKGNATLYDHAMHGFTGSAGMMPAKGGRTDAPDDLVKQAVDYMVGLAK